MQWKLLSNKWFWVVLLIVCGFFLVVGLMSGGNLVEFFGG